MATQQCDQISHDAQSLTVPTLARVWPTNNNVGVSGLCHVLLFYGLGPTDLPSFPSGELALKALTDEEAADKTFGKSPFIRTRNGVRYLLSNDPVFHTDLGEAHRDQCLATFAALNLPLDTPIRLKCRSHSYSISDLLAESVANFSFDQREPAWTAIAYAKYLPPKNEWINRFHERTSFSQLVNHLLAVDITRQSCAGTHIFEALVRIHQSDRRMRILDEKTRTQLHYYVRAKAEQIVRCQEREGAWNWNWCDSIDRKAPMTLQEYILVTGHILEALNALDSSLRPPDSVFARAAGWLNQSLVSKQIPADDGGSWLCPFTHAARCLRCRVGRDETHLRRYAPTNFVTLTGDK